jgi:hypothetical protein
MLEVGYRWATGRPMVLIAEERLPFDLHNHRSIILEKAAEGTPGYVDGKIDEIFKHMTTRGKHNGRGAPRHGDHRHR